MTDPKQLSLLQLSKSTNKDIARHATGIIIAQAKCEHTSQVAYPVLGVKPVSVQCTGCLKIVDYRND